MLLASISAAAAAARRSRSSLWLWILAAAIAAAAIAAAAMDEADKAVLLDLQSHIQNGAELLQWDSSAADPCSSWAGIKCAGSAVSAIALANRGLTGTLTPRLNQLSSLAALALQGNALAGPLPTLRGLASLQSCYLDGNAFDGIPGDFFDGLPSLLYLSLSDNPGLNASGGGWALPPGLQASALLTNLSLTNTSLRGAIPEYLGGLSGLRALRLAYNRLGGAIPATFGASNLQILQANNQQGPFLAGTLEGSVGRMRALRQVWLHQNQISGTLPASLAENAEALTELRLNGNQLVGPIPGEYAAGMKQLEVLALENNRLDGPIPRFGPGTAFTFANNYFCGDEPGAGCAPAVGALLAFLAAAGYPARLVPSWAGDDPCGAPPWAGIGCDPAANVVVALSLPGANLSGSISPRLAELSSLATVRLNNNSLAGPLPPSLLGLASLKLLDVSFNNLTGPVPAFPGRVQLNTAGNPLIGTDVAAPPDDAPDDAPAALSTGRRSRPLVAVGTSLAAVVVGGAVLLVWLLSRYQKRRHRPSAELPLKKSLAPGPPDSGNPEPPPALGSDPRLALSLRTLQMATDSFGAANLVGRGGFGSVYRGRLADGTPIAVKRMHASAASRQGLKEFESELGLLTKLRHRHLVSILGYCVEAGEKALVYEYMSGGTLSHRLFEHAQRGLEPLSWSHRLSVALDVARGLEYLHGLAQNSFIHRDLKPSNVLLDANRRAKISDFGLVRLVPEGERQSIQTMVAGTFGYLAPEYALTGHITTRGDVYSFGVVLMELITGRRALDDRFADGRFQLVPWFRRLVLGRAAGQRQLFFETAIDPTMATATMAEEGEDEMKRSLCTVAELAGHCTNRDASMRPDMSHVVNVLASLFQAWKPCDDDFDDDDESDAALSAEEVRRKLLCWDYDSRTSLTSSNGNATATAASSAPTVPGDS